MRKLGVYIISVVLAFQACTSKQPKKLQDATTTSENMEKKEESNLKAELDAKRANFEAKAPQHKIDVYNAGVEAVAQSGVLEVAINVGDTAPDFSLKNAVGDDIRFSDILAKGPVVLTWYRGGWCPYCNLTLHALQEKLPDFKATGASLLALTPELPDKSMSTTEKLELEFEVLSDIDNQVARQFGVVYSLTEEVGDMYESGFGLSDYNGNTKQELPLAATYIIDTNGIVQYAFLDAEYRNRAEPSEVLEFLQKM